MKKPYPRVYSRKDAIRFLFEIKEMIDDLYAEKNLTSKAFVQRDTLYLKLGMVTGIVMKLREEKDNK